MQKPNLASLFLVFSLIMIFFYFVYHNKKEKMVWHQIEKDTVGTLLEIYRAEWKWYQLDVDANAIQDFWARDIAGLYFYVDPKIGNPVKLISREIALADSKPFSEYYQGNKINTTPYRGYFFKMMSYDANGFYLAKKDTSTNLVYCGADFIVIAYPAFQQELHTFIIDSNKKIIYKKIMNPASLDRPPLDSEQEGWKIVK